MEGMVCDTLDQPGMMRSWWSDWNYFIAACLLTNYLTES